ncbi:mechanosensitive ion channel domain-containing protein, partial [Kamptonema formosum]
WGSSLEFNGQPVTIGLIQRGLSALNFLIVTYWIAQLLTQVVLYALKQYADRSEAMWDDVLIPILQNILPFFTYFIGGLLALQQLGFDLSGLLVTIGGAAFILGFALKDILANFFSGLVLLIDTPFSFGDVVALSDGSRAVIKKIGLRVTTMYLIDSHSEIYIPNANFQGENIINL